MLLQGAKKIHVALSLHRGKKGRADHIHTDAVLTSRGTKEKHYLEL